MMKGLAVTPEYMVRVVDDVPIPQIDHYHVLAKTLSCGLCGTDTKLIHGSFSGKWEQRYPLLLGHESIGEVVEIGKKVESFQIGDRVVFPRLEGRAGPYSSVQGSFCEYGVCADWKAMMKNGVGPGTPGFDPTALVQQRIPRDFDPVYAAMFVTFKEVLSGAIAFGFSSGKSLVVFGQGSVGLCFIRFAKLLGMGPIFSVARSDGKMDDAANLGADYCINSSKEDVISAVRKVCPDGVDFVLDAVGYNPIINTGMELIKMNGLICVYGVSVDKSTMLDWSTAPYNWSMKYLLFPNREQEAAAHIQIMNWVQAGALDMRAFVSHVFPFGRIMEAIELFESKEPKKKIVISYE